MQQSSVLSLNQSRWLRSPAWDLTWISGSVLLMVVPYASYFLGRSLGFNPDDARNAVNVLVAFLIGGPHMYATHLRTTLDHGFRDRHPSIYLMWLVIPAIVIYLGLYHFIFLLTFFFFWASVHVLHQIVYIVDCYNGREPRLPSVRSRAIDYAVVMTALYPVAMYRFVKGTFHIGSNYLYFPPWLKFDAVWWLASAAFAGALALFAMRTVREWREGTINIPKTILICVTVVATFVTPFFHELDVAFQGLNSWHSFQYLGLTWYVNRLRFERGELPRNLWKFSRPHEWWRYYGFNILMNSTALILWGTLLLTARYTGLTFDQSYYMVVLCFLLTHYYHDHILFVEPTNFSLSAERSTSGPTAAI
jgi:hypothetical protein